MVQKRKYGEGELRLGKSIDIQSSIYDYSYLLQIKDEDFENFIDVLTG